MKKDLSSKHYIFLILASTLISLRAYSSLFIKYGRQDTWIYLLISLAIMILIFYFIINLSLKMDTINMTTLFKSYLPKAISNLVLFLFAIGLFLTCIECTSAESNFIYSNFFVESPIFYYLLLFLIPTVYLLTRKFSSILTFIIIAFSFLLCSDVLLTLLIEPYKNYSNLLPIMNNGINLNGIKCIILSLGSLSSICITIPYLRLLTNKDKIKKHILYGSIIASLLLMFSVMGTIASLGPQRAANIFFPGLIQSERVKILDFIEFGEFFYIFRLVVGFFIKYILAAYGIYLIYKDKIKNKLIFFSFFTVLVFIISYITSNNNYILFYFLRYFQFASLILLLLVPFLSYILVSKNYKKSKNNSIKNN